MTNDIILSTATGTTYDFFGDTRIMTKRKGWVDAMQDRYRIRAANLQDEAGVNVEDPTTRTTYHLRVGAKVAIRKFRDTYEVIFDPADVVRTETGEPYRDAGEYCPDRDAPLFDFMMTRTFRSHLRSARNRRGASGPWM